MTTAIPSFAGRYLRGIRPVCDTYGDPVVKEKVPLHTLWSFVEASLSPRARAAVPRWTEKATFADGKREGLATWTNTKSGAEVKVVYKNDMVQSIAYHIKCKHCAVCPLVTNTYARGVLAKTKTSSCDCYSYSGDDGCGGCGGCGRCLTHIVERQWGEKSPW